MKIKYLSLIISVVLLVGCKEKISPERATRFLYMDVQRPWPGDFKKVKELVKSGADVNCRDTYENIHGSTPLLAVAGATGVQGYYSRIYANEHERDTAEQESVKIVKFLVANGADLFIKDQTSSRRNALHLAAIGGWSQMIRTLVELGIDINSRDTVNATALMNAGTSGCLEAVKTCIALGADINAVMNGGYTALDATEQYNTEEMYAMGYVKCKEHDEIIAYLKQQGARQGKELEGVN